MTSIMTLNISNYRKYQMAIDCFQDSVHNSKLHITYNAFSITQFCATVMVHSCKHCIAAPKFLSLSVKTQYNSSHSVLI